MNIKNLILLTLIALLSSCDTSTDKKNAKIDTFDKVFIDSLVPMADKNYSVFYAKIKGNSNDSIRLNISSDKTEDEKFDYYFIGDFEKEIRMDYYGESKKYIKLDPYKATDGKLELDYQL
ncbi:hypothetical protein [Christiangramia sp. OXR-203]|uniref:hypothetical protein n=1 Tax=Christiangramia sp. OXR-203 TaxID=3100176 RepID=UPI002AC9ADEE|nr:hypothetical protein [Christiangramia sp. OXR-203]WPY97655.1 hypothetical protein T8I65_10760 [Christiangramia sp. OXR-203]